MQPNQQPIDISPLGIERLTAREREQTLRQGGGTTACTLSGIDEAVEVLDTSPCDPHLEQLQIPHYAGEQVVEVMREPAGELAYCFHLLALA